MDKQYITIFSVYIISSTLLHQKCNEAVLLADSWPMLLTLSSRNLIHVHFSATESDNAATEDADLQEFSVCPQIDQKKDAYHGYNIAMQSSTSCRKDYNCVSAKQYNDRCLRNNMQRDYVLQKDFAHAQIVRRRSSSCANMVWRTS